jgi:LysR family transcriptional activator of nhaA
MFNFNHLYYFYVTAKSGGVTAAAEYLRISQPSLSSQLKVLEQSLDVKLFQKVGRINRLTRTGFLVYGFCRQMFEVAEQMKEQISKKVPSASKRIHIGVSDEIDRSFVVEVVSSFLKKFKVAERPKVVIVAGPQEQLVERLRFRELDALITQSAMIERDLQNVGRAEIPVMLAYSANIKVPKLGKSFGPTQILKQIASEDETQWLMPSSRYKLRIETNHFLEANELTGRVVFETDVVASLVRSVVDHVGVAFLPVIYCARELQQGSLRVIGPKGGYWKYRVWLSCHGQNSHDSSIIALAASFGEVCNAATELHFGSKR